MEANLEEIDHLVGEFLELSKLEAGASVLQVEGLRLQDLAQACISAIPGKQPIRLSGESRLLQGDPARLQRVISTLLENALKYGAGSTIHVQVGPRSLSVSDRGPGVAEVELPRLFEPFFRGSDTTSVRGYGIGLSMARQILSLHGGQIEAQNRMDGGLVIRFTLPIRDHGGIDPAEPTALPFEM
jgi:signal transduction histidine kinase